MIDSCCEISKNFNEFLENLYGDEECLDDEIIKNLYDLSSQKELVVSFLDEKYWDQEREMHILDIENENHQANVNCYKNQVSPLFEYEIDQLFKSHVTTQANAGLQCSHSQEFLSETYSIIENENLSLNDDSHETDETIQEVVVSKPIFYDDFLQGDQLTRTVFFHEEDRAIMFNNIEEFFLFKDDLDYELEEYESGIDSMP